MQLGSTYRQVQFRMRLFLVLLPFIWLCAIAPAQDLVIRDAKVYTSPEAPSRTHVTVLIRGGKIAALGSNARTPAGITALQCNGCVVFSGFWNSHVHFTGAQWDGAASRPAEELTRDMQAMLTHSGFSTVVDVASDPNDTVVLRRRIQNGEVAGPNIYTSGFALYPPHGIPFYLDDLPEKVRAKLQQPNTPAAAVEAVRENQAHGSDVVKLFTGSYLTPDDITHMPLEIAKAAVQAGHDHQQLVFAHPSDLKGVQIAIEGGVDVLAHAPDTIAGVNADLVNEMVSKCQGDLVMIVRYMSSKDSAYRSIVSLGRSGIGIIGLNASITKSPFSRAIASRACFSVTRNPIRSAVTTTFLITDSIVSDIDIFYSS